MSRVRGFGCWMLGSPCVAKVEGQALEPLKWTAIVLMNSVIVDVANAVEIQCSE